MMDFTTLDNEGIATYLVEKQSDLDCEGIAFDDVFDRLLSGKATIEARTYGFAIITQSSDKPMPYLWILFIDGEKRGKGLGRRFMREIIAKYSTEYHLSLRCYGSARRKFFGRCGLRVEHREGDERLMTTDKDRY